MLFKFRIKMFVHFFFFLKSNKSIFAVILPVVTAVYFAGTTKEFILAGKILYLHFLKNI